MSSQAGASRPGFVGYIHEITSHTEAEAVVFAQQSRILRYGALAVIEDPRTKTQYLAFVVDVTERSVAPHVDAQRLQQLHDQLQSLGFADAKGLLDLLYSPSQQLVQMYGVRKLHLRILGVIDPVSRRLRDPGPPPRPAAVVFEPDPALLQSLLSPGKGVGLYLGRHAYHPDVNVYLDPRRLTTHMALVGQTGSGKTETVKRLVVEYVFNKHGFSTSGGVVIFDVHGEYTGYPYSRRNEGTYPLLDAALYPGEFHGAMAQGGSSSVQGGACEEPDNMDI